MSCRLPGGHARFRPASRSAVRRNASDVERDRELELGLADPQRSAREHDYERGGKSKALARRLAIFGLAPSSSCLKCCVRSGKCPDLLMSSFHGSVNNSVRRQGRWDSGVRARFVQQG